MYRKDCIFGIEVRKAILNCSEFEMFSNFTPYFLHKVFPLFQKFRVYRLLYLTMKKGSSNLTKKLFSEFVIILVYRGTDSLTVYMLN